MVTRTHGEGKWDHPKTMADDTVEVLHGQVIRDPYRWLEDHSTPEVKRWINEQNKFTHKFIDGIESKTSLYDRFKEFTNVEAFGGIGLAEKPLPSGKRRYFQYRRMSGQDFHVLYYKDGIDGELTVALDPNGFSDDKKTALDWISKNADGTLLAYTTSERGDDTMTVHVLDLNTKTLLKDTLSDIRYGSLSWLPDNTGFYYSKWPDPKTAKNAADMDHVYFHKLGTDQPSDIGIFGKGFGSEKACGIATCGNGQYLIIAVSTSGGTTSEAYYKKIGDDSPVRKFESKENSEFHIIEIVNDKVYALTNYEAPKFRIVSFDIENPKVKSWKNVISECQDTVEDADIVGGKLIVNYLKDVHTAIKIFSLHGKFLNQVALPSLGSATIPSGNLSSKEAFFVFDSYISPTTLFKLNLENYTVTKVEQTKYNFDFNELELKQEWCNSKDGTRIPMFIVHKKGIIPDGNNPVVLYGYGGFNVNLTPDFTYSILPFLQDGGVYVVANIRGGNEFGKEWHEGGMLYKKQNVFDDFISAAESLIGNGYTTRDRLAIMGGSNGGLLVAVSMLQRPDLFKAVICEVPLTDMLRFHKFGGGAIWTEEYGNPDVKGEFDYLLKYSPYHNVKPGGLYPSLLINAGENDTRTDPLHAYKFAAMMQNNNASDNPIFLLTQSDIGHGFGRPMEGVVQELSEIWSFIYKELGIVSQSTKISTLENIRRST